MSAHSIIRYCLYFLFLSSLAFTTGCATSYNRAWSQYEDKTPTDTFTGRWDGSWLSHSNGHKGRLRAMVSKQTAHKYDVRFHATYAKVLQFSYAAEFNGTPAGTAIHFEGENDLGKLAGGVFGYKGTAEGDTFDATYSSEKDHGVFNLQRVK